jgi:hypothetical protein
MSDDLRGGPVDELGAGIETEFGEGKGNGCVADEALKLHELLGGEALHGADFTAHALLHVVVADGHLGRNFGNFGTAMKSAIKWGGEFIDADGFADKVTLRADDGCAKRHEPGEGAMEHCPVSLEVGAGCAFLEKDAGFACNAAARGGRAVDQRDPFFAVGEWHEF